MLEKYESIGGKDELWFLVPVGRAEIHYGCFPL